MSDFLHLSLKNKSLDSPDSANDAGTALEWLSAWQGNASGTLGAQTLPTRKTENWKYTNLRTLNNANYHVQGSSTAVDVVACSKILEQHAIEGTSNINIVFVNGVFSSELSSPLTENIPAGLTIVRFSEANEVQKSQIRAALGEHISLEDHPFAALNSSLVEDGLFIHVEKNQIIEPSIQINYLSTRGENEFSANVRTLVHVEAFAKATVLEHFMSSEEEQNVFTNNVTELKIDESAKLYHYRLNEEEQHALHIGHVSCSLAKHATLESFNLAMGSALQRNDIVVNHRGEGAHCQLNGVYLPRGSQLTDFHTCIEHAVPHCTTSETFRGIVSDSAKAVFNGRIHIHPQAQKTLAELSNKNLLTSNKAEVDTKPELEIYADDVQCAHGATVAQIDELSIHYLRTRGISTEEARVLLSFGFINELINTIADESLVAYLRPKLAALFARDPKLMRHLL